MGKCYRSIIYGEMLWNPPHFATFDDETITCHAISLVLLFGRTQKGQAKDAFRGFKNFPQSFTSFYKTLESIKYLRLTLSLFESFIK